MKIKLKFLAVQFCLLTAFTFAQADRDYLSEGDKYLAQFDNVDAVISYENAYKISPNDYRVISKLTFAYNDAGEEFVSLNKKDVAKTYINKAVKFAEAMQKEYPDSALTYTNLALAYGNIAMFKGGSEKIKYAFKVKDNAEEAIKLNPTDVYPYIILGIYYREAANLNWFEKTFARAFLGGVPEGTYEQSKQMFYKALSYDPEIISAIYNLAKTYYKLGDVKNEKECLDKTMQLPVKNFRDKYAKIKAALRLEQLKG